MTQTVKTPLQLSILLVAYTLFISMSYEAVASPTGRVQEGDETAFVRTQTLVPPTPLPCPAGTTDYQGDAAAYSCVRVYQDNGGTGYPVGLRQGRTGEGAFGLLHALLDHNVDEETIATVVTNNAAGIAQGNDRFLYGLEFRVADVGLIAVEVIVAKAPSNEAPDNFDLGLVTAYCRGLDRCPDGVNATIP